jgi:hypothetical protein
MEGEDELVIWWMCYEESRSDYYIKGKEFTGRSKRLQVYLYSLYLDVQERLQQEDLNLSKIL